MSLKLPPGVVLNGVEPGESISDSEWSFLEPPDESVKLPKTVSEQLQEDADL